MPGGMDSSLSLGFRLCPMHFSRTSCSVGLALLLGVCSTAHSQSMTEAVQIALSQYPAILAAQARSQASDAEVSVAQSKHWPQVSLQGTQSTYSSGLSSPFSPSNTWIQSPTVSLNVWSGWRIESQVERARALSDAGKKQHQITRDEVALLALEGYLNWARAGELVQLANDNLKAHERIRGNIATIVSIDSGRRVDLEQADVRLENARLTLRQRETELEITKQRLTRMLLMSPPAQPSGVEVKYGAVPSQVDVALSQINDQHPIIAQQLSQVEAAKASIRTARSEFSPSVDISYGKQVSQGTGQGDYVTQLTVSIPFFSGGSSYSGMRAAHAQLQASEYALQEARVIQRERLMSAWVERESAQARALVGRQQAQKGNALVLGYEQQFQVGRRSLLDLLNVQNDLLNYRSNAVSAMFEERVSYARILAALGKLAAAFQGSKN